MTAIGVPQDETGTYPALSGLAAVQTSRRFLARLIDVVASLFLYLAYSIGLVGAGVLGSDGSAGIDSVPLLAIAGLLNLAWSLFALFTWLKHAATPGQFFLGLRHVYVANGQIARGGYFLKYLVEGLIVSFTLGLGLIAAVVTIRPPLNRNLFDRISKVMMVDAKAGRAPGTAAPPVPTAAPQPASPSGITAVPFEDKPAPQAAAGPMVNVEAPTFARGGHLDAVGTEASDGIIESVPGRPSRATSPVATPPPAPAPPAPPQHGPGLATPLQSEDQADHTMVANLPLQPTSTPVTVSATAVLDNGQEHSLDGILLLGRDPSHRPGYESGTLVVVPDQTRSISKTHLAIGREAGELFVVDLMSTNGVIVVHPDGTTTTTQPGRRLSISAGDTIRYGARELQVKPR